MMNIEFTPENTAALMENLKERFSEGRHTLIFKKKDGTVREMIASRDASEIPEETFKKWMVPNPDKPRKESTEALPVYEFAVEGFRSFRLDSLISVDGLTPAELLGEVVQ